ncbi:hypothetical protein J6590_048446 [Homalodisca vitripennis]|nr:hypothetical protein J6590_048446 [Homalodisca vitripennis]
MDKVQCFNSTLLMNGTDDKIVRECTADNDAELIKQGVEGWLVGWRRVNFSDCINDNQYTLITCSKRLLAGTGFVCERTRNVDFSHAGWSLQALVTSFLCESRTHTFVPDASQGELPDWETQNGGS